MIKHVPRAQVLASHAFLIQSSWASSSVGVVPRTSGLSECPVVCGLHREKQIRNRWDTPCVCGGCFQSGGHIFPDSRLGDLPRAPRGWVVELGPARLLGLLAALPRLGLW